MIFLVLSRKLILENMILLFREKKEDHFSPKNAWKHDSFCIFGKYGILLTYKYDITNCVVFLSIVIPAIILTQ